MTRSLTAPKSRLDAFSAERWHKVADSEHSFMHPPGLKRSRSTSANTAKVKKFIESLPAELYTNIRNHVFFLPDDHPEQTTEVVVINEFYTPPKYLQINEATRKSNTQEYYAESLFLINDIHLAFELLHSIGAQRRVMIEKLWIHDPDTPADTDKRTRQYGVPEEERPIVWFASGSIPFRSFGDHDPRVREFLERLEMYGSVLW